MSASVTLIRIEAVIVPVAGLEGVPDTGKGILVASALVAVALETLYSVSLAPLTNIFVFFGNKCLSSKVIVAVPFEKVSEETVELPTDNTSFLANRSSIVPKSE